MKRDNIIHDNFKVSSLKFINEWIKAKIVLLAETLSNN